MGSKGGSLPERSLRVQEKSAWLLGFLRLALIESYGEAPSTVWLLYCFRFSLQCVRELGVRRRGVRIRRLAPLTERDIARATGAGVSTVSAWLHRTRAPSGRRAERLVELSAIIERLAAVLDQEYVPVWLNRPLAALDHRKPIDVLASGGYEELSRIVAGLEAPTFS